MGSLHGVATPEHALVASADGQEWPVAVQVTDAQGDTVFRARVMMWVSPRKRAA